MKKNYTSTIYIPTLHSESVKGNIPDYKGQMKTKEEVALYRAYYAEYIKPMYDKQHVIIRKLEQDQPLPYNTATRNVLWNKCRYFEMSEYDSKIRRFVAQSAKLSVKYNNMFVGNSEKLEALIKAYNKLNIKLKIQQDWI